MVMTVAEVQAELAVLRKEFPARAHISASVYSDRVSVTVYPKDITANDVVRGEAKSDFAEAFADLRAKWAERSERYAAEMIRSMALEIIRITAERGQCDAFALRAGKFSQEDVATYGERAVADANEIASNGPFSIITSLANAA